MAHSFELFRQLSHTDQAANLWSLKMPDTSHYCPLPTSQFLLLWETDSLKVDHVENHHVHGPVQVLPIADRP